MKTIGSLSLLLATAMCSLAPAQSNGLLNGAGLTLQTIPLVATLSPGNVTPAPTGITASGAGVVYLHLVKDITGTIVAGTVDFNANYTLPSGSTPVSLTINVGTAGKNGAVIFNSGFKTPTTTPVPPNGTVTSLQVQILPGDTAGLAALQALATNPTNYYVRLTTSDFPSGIIRSQLQRASTAIFLAPLKVPTGTTPTTGSTPAGLAALTVLYTTDANNNVTGGTVTTNFSVSGVAPNASLTGLQLLKGTQGSGTVAFDSGLSATSPITVNANGAATGQFTSGALTADQIASLADVLSNSGKYYINLSSADATNGLLAGTVQQADQTSFPMILAPGNEVPPVTDLLANAPGVYTLYSLRKADGTAASGLAIFDYFPIFPVQTTVTGMHMHNGDINTAGPVVIDSGLGANPVSVPPNGYDLYRVALITSATGIAALNSVLVNPELHYVNIHTPKYPGGAMRSQVAPANTGQPTVVFLGDGSGNTHVGQFAPGALIYLYGTNLSKVNSDLTSLNLTSYPTSLSGTQVSLNGTKIPVLAVSSGIVIVQVPTNTPSGIYQLILSNGNGASIIPTVAVLQTSK